MPLGRLRFRNGGRPTGYRYGVSPRGGRPKRALREPAGARCRRMAQPARAPAHPAPRRAPIEPGADGRMRILLFSSYGMLAFLASKRLLLSGGLSFGGVAPLLAAGLAFLGCHVRCWAWGAENRERLVSALSHVGSERCAPSFGFRSRCFSMQQAVCLCSTNVFSFSTPVFGFPQPILSFRLPILIFDCKVIKR